MTLRPILPKRRLKGLWLRAALIVSAPLLLAYCQTTPEPEPEVAVQPEPEVAVQPEPEVAVQPEPEVAVQPEPEPEPEPPVTLAESELNVARVAIARAEEAEAYFYDPTNLTNARAQLQRAERLRESDPDQAREAVAQSTSAAESAYDRSVRLAAQRLSLLMEDGLEQLREIEANNFAPEEYAASIAAVALSRELHGNGDLARYRDTAMAVIGEMQLLRTTLEDQLATVTGLRRDTEDLIDEAQAAEAHLHASDQFAQLNALYLGGVDQLQAYDLDEADRIFGAARELGRDTLIAARRGQESIEEGAVDTLMLEVMRKLEAASLMTVVTDDGQVIRPDPWQGDAELEGQGSGVSDSDTSAVPVPAWGVLVLGQEAQDSLLVQAQELWRLGVAEREAGNLRRALEYFQEAERYVDAYQAYAVQGVYTVRLIPERRDALWRIAEYDFIYGDPFLWPNIWRRNRRLIQNPDLIYPGWQLIIPPR